MRDAEVGYAIHPIVRKYLLTAEDATKALIAYGVPRAANVARITSGLNMTAAHLTERNSVANGESAPAVKAAISADNPVSKHNWRQ